MKMNVILKKVFCVDIFDSVFFMFSVSRTKSLILEFLIFTDFLHLHVAWVDRFYILPSLDFSSNADFTNFHCFAWQVIGASCNLHNISIRRNSNSNSFFVPGRDPDTDLQHRRGATVLWPAQRDLPEEGEEPERRVGVGRQHWQLHTICWGGVHDRETNNQIVKIFFL